VIDTHLANALSDVLHIAWMTQRHAAEASLDSRNRNVVAKPATHRRNVSLWTISYMDRP